VACYRVNLYLLLLTKYYSGRQIKKNEMGEACGTFGKQETCIKVLVGDVRERHHLGNRNIDGRIILRWIGKKWGVEVWIGLI
jgi:hypothetical protein